MKKVFDFYEIIVIKHLTSQLETGRYLPYNINIFSIILFIRIKQKFYERKRQIYRI